MWRPRSCRRASNSRTSALVFMAVTFLESRVSWQKNWQAEACPTSPAGSGCGGREVAAGLRIRGLQRLSSWRLLFSKAGSHGRRIGRLKPAPPAQRARDVAAEKLPQGFEFEDFSACLHGGYFSRKQGLMAEELAG